MAGMTEPNMKVVYVVGARPMKVGGEERNVGDMVPEAGEWKFLHSYTGDGSLFPVLVATLPASAREALAEWEEGKRQERKHKDWQAQEVARAKAIAKQEEEVAKERTAAEELERAEREARALADRGSHPGDTAPGGDGGTEAPGGDGDDGSGEKESDGYEEMPYAELKEEARRRGFEWEGNIAGEELIKALRKEDAKRHYDDKDQWSYADLKAELDKREIEHVGNVKRDEAVAMLRKYDAEFDARTVEEETKPPTE